MRARKRLGQHFLEPAWVRKVADAIAPEREDQFLEIGPGTGALTIALAPRVDRIVAVEIDRELAVDLAARSPHNVHIIAGDFLETDLSILLTQEFRTGARVRVVGNLPYNASSPILFRLITVARCFTDATLMLQREVADRLVARRGTAEYGVLTVLTTVHAQVTRLLEVPPGAFRPPPKVRSTIVRLHFHAPSVDPALLPRFERLVRAVFQHRRKTVANAIRGASCDLDPAEVLRALAAAGIDGARRPETLEVAEFTRLAERLPL